MVIWNFFGLIFLMSNSGNVFWKNDKLSLSSKDFQDWLHNFGIINFMGWNKIPSHNNYCDLARQDFQENCKTMINNNCINRMEIFQAWSHEVQQDHCVNNLQYWSLVMSFQILLYKSIGINRDTKRPRGVLGESTLSPHKL
jgi:hypothetical protein